MNKLLKKISIFFIIIFALQTAISSFDWGMIVFKEFEQLKKYLAKEIDIIFFGDSSVYTHDKYNDTDKRTIRQMLQDTIPNLKCMPVVHPAYHMGIYLEFCKYIAESEYKPKMVIAPINIRSFSPEWDLQPMYQFTEEKAIISSSPVNTFLLNVFNKPLKVFKYGYDTDIISNTEFANSPVYFKDSIVGDMNEYIRGFENMTEPNKKKKFLLRYMFYIHEKHRKLEELREIGRLMKSKGIIPLFYIIPIDWEEGSKYFPGEIEEVTRKNASLLVRELEKIGGAVIDMSLGLKHKDFNYEYYPNEHMKQAGRRYVAVKIAEKMKEIGIIDGME